MDDKSQRLCECGNEPIGYLHYPNGSVRPYCKKCDPDPEIDESDVCYACGEPSYRSEYIGSRIYLGVCEDCDDGTHLGYEHLGGL